jgi:RimJ/RimL family protein N-acetyltransferase
MNIVYGKIVLRALERDDMELLRETVNDPEMERMVVGWSFPISTIEQNNWFERSIGSKFHQRFAIEYDGKFVGISTLTDIDWKNRSAFHGIKLIKSAPKGQGIGFDAVCGTMQYAFEELQLNRLTGGILTYNVPSMKLYKKCGWKEEGLFREQVFKNNQYYDEIPMAILRSDYFEWKKNLNK